MQERYAESIAYVNKVSGTSVTADQLRTERADHAGVPILKKGDVIAVRPAEAKAAFWLAEIAEDENPELGM